MCQFNTSETSSVPEEGPPLLLGPIDAVLAQLDLHLALGSGPLHVEEHVHEPAHELGGLGLRDALQEGADLEQD